MNPVELHVVSDSTGETAARLVQALEAQFPEQEFVEIRHPRVESVADYRRIARAARAGDILTLYVYAPDLDQHQLKTIRVEDR